MKKGYTDSGRPLGIYTHNPKEPERKWWQKSKRSSLPLTKTEVARLNKQVESKLTIICLCGIEGCDNTFKISPLEQQILIEARAKVTGSKFRCKTHGGNDELLAQAKART
jgi:hypothetical protein